MRSHAFARKRPEHTHRVTVSKPWLCFLVNTIIRHSSRGNSQPHDSSFRCGGGLEGVPCGYRGFSLGSSLTPLNGRHGCGKWEMERAGLFWGKNSSRQSDYWINRVPPSAPHFLAFRRDHVAERTCPHPLGQMPRKNPVGEISPAPVAVTIACCEGGGSWQGGRPPPTLSSPSRTAKSSPTAGTWRSILGRNINTSFVTSTH